MPCLLCLFLMQSEKKEEKSVEKKTNAEKAASDKSSSSPSSLLLTPPSSTPAPLAARNTVKDPIFSQFVHNSKMKEFEKALTIGFLPNTTPGMAPLSSTVTPSWSPFSKFAASTTSLLHSPIANVTISKLPSEKLRLKPGKVSVLSVMDDLVHQ